MYINGLKKHRRLYISDSSLVHLSVICFFSFGLIRMGFNQVIGVGDLSIIASLFIVYTPLALAFAASPRKIFVRDFALLYFFILLFFFVSFMLHQENEYYFTREGYGVWDHVLCPYRGIYAYLFIRLINDPKKLKTDLLASGYINIVYGILRYYSSVRRGTWYGVAGQSAAVEMSYSVQFGYEILPFTLLFLYYALQEKKWKYWIPAAIYLVLVLIAGSRGPIIFIGLFICLYLFKQIRQTKRKLITIIGTSVAFVLLYNTYDYLLSFFSKFLFKMNMNSRFIELFLNGRISSDSGRTRIWQTAIEMIREKPLLGYGALGTRPRISQIVIAGYPHNVFLEILVDFGVIIGGLIIILIIYHSIMMLMDKKNDGYQGLFLVFFCSACSLLISLTFWSAPTLWICMALIVNNNKYYEKIDKKKRQCITTNSC